MTSIRNFSTATILTAYSGKMLVGDIGKLYDILGFMTDDQLMTHQLPLAADAVKPELLLQLPWLADVPELPPIPDDVPAKQWVGDYLAGVVAEYGVEHDLHPAPLRWGTHDPLRDLTNLRVGNTPHIIPVTIDRGEDHQ